MQAEGQERVRWPPPTPPSFLHPAAFPEGRGGGNQAFAFSSRFSGVFQEPRRPGRGQSRRGAEHAPGDDSGAASAESSSQTPRCL